MSPMNLDTTGERNLVHRSLLFRLMRVFQAGHDLLP